MSEENGGKETVDLKARLGLHKKLAELEASRGGTAPTAAPVSADQVQQPPRPDARITSQFAVGNMDLDESMGMGKKSRISVIIGIAVLTIVAFGAGIVSGKSFKLRSLENIRTQNAQLAYDKMVQQRITPDQNPELGTKLGKVVLAISKADENIKRTPNTALKQLEILQLKLAEKELDGTPNLRWIRGVADTTLKGAQAEGANATEVIKKGIANMLLMTTNVGIVRSFAEETRGFHGKIVVAKAAREEKTNALREAKNSNKDDYLAVLFEYDTAVRGVLSEYIPIVKEFVSYKIEYSLDTLARPKFFLTEIFAEIAGLERLVVEVNFLASEFLSTDALLKAMESRWENKGAVKDLVQTFWIEPAKRKSKTNYGTGRLIRQIAQELDMDGTKGRAILLDGASDAQAVPLTEIASIDITPLIRERAERYEIQLRMVLLDRMERQLARIIDSGSSIDVEGLRKILDRFRNRSAYFTF
ncbi:MAG: hypothetical protein CMH54_11275 [Myxococcales bacterium]|nr:hypothetical protein [Myxococcales bacterium]